MLSKGDFYGKKQQKETGQHCGADWISQQGNQLSYQIQLWGQERYQRYQTAGSEQRLDETVFKADSGRSELGWTGYESGGEIFNQ